MTSPEDRLRKLVTLALGTSNVEEARTSALLALKLAQREEIDIRGSEYASRPAEKPAKREPRNTKSPPTRAQSRGGGGRKKPGGYVTRFAESSGTCDHCHCGFTRGSIVASMPGSGERVYHAGCAAERG